VNAELYHLFQQIQSIKETLALLASHGSAAEILVFLRQLKEKRGLALQL
jgi:hypothetical protein